jgi:hypothetical protein
MTEMEKFIREYAASIGMNPDIVMQTVLNEGGVQSLDPNNYARQALGTESYGQEESYGPLQLNTRSGVGARALAAGIDPRDPKQAFAAAKFGMDVMKKEGLGQWHGWKGDPWAHIKGYKGANSGVTLTTVPVPQGPEAVAAAETPAAPKTWKEKLKDLFKGDGEEKTEDDEESTDDWGALAKAISPKLDPEVAAAQTQIAPSSIGMNTPDPNMMANAQMLMSQLLEGRRKRYGISLMG